MLDTIKQSLKTNPKLLSMMKFETLYLSVEKKVCLNSQKFIFQQNFETMHAVGQQSQYQLPNLREKKKEKDKTRSDRSLIGFVESRIPLGASHRLRLIKLVISQCRRNFCSYDNSLAYNRLKV